MSQVSRLRSQVSWTALWGCSLNVFVFVFFIVFVFVIVIWFVRSCLLITLIACLKGHKSLRVLFGSVFQKCLVGSDKWTYRAVRWQLKKLQVEAQEKLKREAVVGPASWVKWESNLKINLKRPNCINFLRDAFDVMTTLLSRNPKTDVNIQFLSCFVGSA